MLIALLAFAPAGEAAAEELSAPPLTYVAIGASDSVGVGADIPTVEGWVPRFGQALGPGTNVVNLGVSGSLLRQAVDQQLPAAVAAKPDVVTVWLGVNDFNMLVPLSSYAADLDFMLGTLQRETGARVLVGNLPDLSVVPWYRQMSLYLLSWLRWGVGVWNASVANTAATRGATLVDLYGYGAEISQHPEYVSADGFHPSSLGYARLGELFYAAAQR